MSTGGIIIVNLKTEMDIEKDSDEQKKGNLEMRMGANIDSYSNSDENRFQRRHFSNKMSSDIFFRESAIEGNVSSGSANVDREELLYPSAGHDTRYADQREGERQHFQPYCENDMQTENDDDRDTEADSSESDSAEQNQTQRQHFHEKTSSDIFFRHSAIEGEVSSGSSSVDRGEVLFPSAGHYTRYADGKVGERRHFESPPDDGTEGERQCSDNNMQIDANADQNNDVIQSETSAVTEVESPDVAQNQRQHFHEKNKSDIFFRDPPTTGNVSSGSANVDREEILFPSAGHYTRYADGKVGERRHFDSPDDDGTEGDRQCFELPPGDEIQPENNEKEADDLSETEKTEVVETDDVDENQMDRRHFHDKTSSDIFFQNLPTEDNVNVSSGCDSVDREELLVSSAGHDMCYADRREGERRHFHSP